MADDTAANPFTEADLATWNEKLKELDTADLVMTKAENAGIDVSAQRAKSQEIRSQLLRLKQSFFPGR
jgi:hypothetical protein